MAEGRRQKLVAGIKKQEEGLFVPDF